MTDVLTLLRPRFLSMKNRMASAPRRGRVPVRFFYGAAGLVLWGALFALFYRVLKYFNRREKGVEVEVEDYAYRHNRSRLDRFSATGPI